MSTTVLAPSGLEISSNDSSPEEMLESLTIPEKDNKPRVLVDKGEPVKAKGKDSEASKAASVLGKKGGEAAAKARAEGKDKPKGPSVDLDEMALADAKKRAAKKEGGEAEAGAQDDTDAEAKAAADKKKHEGNPRHDPEARIAIKVREAREATERAERAERQLATERRERERIAREAEDLRAGRQPAERREEQPRAERAAPGLPPKPKVEDFESYEQYLDARDEHREKVSQHRRRVEEYERGYVEHVTGRVGQFAKRVNEAKAQDPGLVDAIEELGMVTSFKILRDEQGRPTKIERAAQIRGEHLIGDEIVQSDNPGALIRYFADNRAEYQRLAALGPSAIQRAMAKLEGRLERSEAAKGDTSAGRELSKASSPGRSLPGSPHTAEPSLADVDFATHMDIKRRARA